jgi:hypothetical protein
MALIINDRVLETSTTTGTAAFTLAGAVQDYQSFATGIGGNNTTYYSIVNPNTGQWETGLGTLNALGTTLTRTTIYRSSNSNSAVTFSAGTKLVFCDYLASQSVNLDANSVLSVFNNGANSSTAFTAVPQAIANFITSQNNYSQINLQNVNAGAFASSDIVITADNGSDTTYFLDMGLASSGFNYPTYSGILANDGYLLVQNGNLDFMVGAAGKATKWFQGGTLTANEVMRISPTNNNLLIGTTTDTGSKLRATGIIESTSGGFKYPDGTTQSTANTNWKILRNGINVGYVLSGTTYPVQSYNFTFTDSGALTTSNISMVPSAQNYVVLPDISSGTVTTLTGLITFASAHNLSTGNTITISGASPSGWNGTWAVTVSNSTQVTITFVSAPATYVSGATTTATTTASGPVLGGDELEMDGITCAATCTTNGTVNVYISSVNGAPLLGLRNFNYSIN